jgi:hypothetical protein
VSAAEKDYVYRRIVIEYGRLYGYVYMTDQDGKVLANSEEAFKQPFRLDFKDVKEEAQDCFDVVYQHLQDTILYYATARDDDEDAESEETPETD